MKRKLRRLTALILALSMCLSVLSATAWAAEVPETEIVAAETAGDAEAPAEEAETPAEETEDTPAVEADEEDVVTASSGTCGDNLTWTLDDAGTLTISGTGDMYDYGDTAWPEWEDYYTTITKVEVEDGVTSIGAYAFGFSEKGTYFSLTTVSLPTSVVSIREGAFAWDDAYFDPFIVYYDGTMQDWANIDINYDGKLNGLRFADINCSDGTILGEDPSNYYDEDEDENETSGECGDGVYWELDTDTGVLTIYGDGDMYANIGSFSLLCGESAEEPSYCSYDTYGTGWDTYADDITSIVIESGVTTIGNGVFMGLNSLTDVTIPDTVTEIGLMAFAFCGNLTSMTIPDSVTFIDFCAFLDCDTLEEVTLGSGLETIREYVFYDCTSLETVNYNGTTDEFDYIYIYGGNSLLMVQTIQCTDGNLTDAYVFYIDDVGELIVDVEDDWGDDEEDDDWGTAETSGQCGDDLYWELDEDTGVLTIYGTGEMYDADEDDMNGAFCFDNRILSVIIEDGVTSIGSYAFFWNDCLTEVSIPDSVTSIGSSAFYGCTALTSFTIPDSVTSLGEAAFCDCDGLTSVALSNAIDTIEEDTFNNCSSLTSITIPSNVKSICTRAFQSCDSMTSITIPASVTYIEDSAIGYTGDEFWGDEIEKLENLTIYGYKGSAADTYATKNDLKFVSLGTVSLSTPKLSSVSNTTSGVKVTWSKVTGATKYRVFRKTGSGSWKKVADTTSTSYTDTTAKSGTTYTYTVRCISYDGTTFISSYNKTGLSIKFLTAGKISSLTNTSKGITVKWSKVTGATGYYVYRKTGSGSYTQIAKITKNATVSYTDTSVKSKNGTTYTYAVRPYYGTTRGSYTGKKTVRLTGVSISSLKNSASKKMTVKWAKNAKATGYQIQYSTSSSFSSYKSVTVTGASSVSKVISSLTKGKKYYVRVRAYKTVSGTKYYSAWSGSKSVKISK